MTMTKRDWQERAVKVAEVNAALLDQLKELEAKVSDLTAQLKKSTERCQYWEERWGETYRARTEEAEELKQERSNANRQRYENDLLTQQLRALEKDFARCLGWMACAKGEPALEPKPDNPIWRNHQ